MIAAKYATHPAKIVQMKLIMTTKKWPRPVKETSQTSPRKSRIQIVQSACDEIPVSGARKKLIGWESFQA